ncbi:hypothetical protein LTSEADE_0918 [Salmonella enterica subsp. enterica serovar Adelaide str. A4-669]|uniref:UDP-2,3-diacylglucosamine hydrolase n=1 Tax=Salmonella enterica subsp. enterica serovar Adelaide str. A4-669 TaxID=913063 RepID=A0A6C8GRN8_SALET|nr:hypothetical protein LTSEADE_0918 [Salmonella enterica subsp. enterica serovar Adelaide str. A4-669]
MATLFIADLHLQTEEPAIVAGLQTEEPAIVRSSPVFCVF